MNPRITKLAAAGAEYARARRAVHLPPIRGTVTLVPGRSGPVVFICHGREYTLVIAGRPAPAA